MIDEQEDVVFIPLETCYRPGPRQRPVPEHAFEVGEILCHPSLPKQHVAEWLRVAAGIFDVGVDLQAYDHSTMMCGSAYEYYNEHSKVASLIMREITRFLFIWGALEAYVGELPERRPKAPFIKKKLDKYEEHFPRLVHFDCHANGLRTHAAVSRAFKRSERITSTKVDANISSVFSAAAALRNELAHGVLNMPSAPAWGGRPGIDLAVVACAQRLVLFTIQMLALVDYANQGIEVYGYGYDGDSIDLPVEVALQTVHLEPIQYDWGH